MPSILAEVDTVTNEEWLGIFLRGTLHTYLEGDSKQVMQ